MSGRRKGSVFKKRVSLFGGNTVGRTTATIDIRLTPSDTIHDLIHQKAEEEQLKIKKEKNDRKREKKFLKKGEAPIISQRESLAVPPPPASSRTSIQKYPKVDDRGTHVKHKVGDQKSKPSPAVTTKKTGGDRKNRVVYKGRAKVGPIGGEAPAHPATRPAQPEHIQHPPDHPKILTVEDTEDLTSTVTLFSVKAAPSSFIDIAWLDEIDKRVVSQTGSQHSGDSFEMGPIKAQKQVKKQLREIKRQLEEPNIEEEYCPYEHRDTKNGITNCEAIALITRALLSTCVLKMPLIFSNVGAYSGALYTIMVLVWISFSMHMYVHGRNELCKILRVPHLCFTDAIRQAILLGPANKKVLKYALQIINILFIFHQWILNLRYCIFFGTYSRIIFNGASLVVFNSFYIVPTAILCVFCMCITSLRLLAKISIVANLACFTALVIILFRLTGKTLDESPMENTTVVLPITRFWGESIMEINCLAAFLLVESNMREPKVIRGYSGIFNLSLMFAGLWYMMIGFFSMYHFGMITDYTYLSRFRYKHYTNVLVYVLFLASFIVSYSVQAFRVIEILSDYWKGTYLAGARNMRIWLVLQRCGYCVVAFYFLYFPKIILSATLMVGYSIGPFLMLTCPAIIEGCISWHGRRLLKNRFRFYLDVGMFILSIYAIFAVGVWFFSDSEHLESSFL